MPQSKRSSGKVVTGGHMVQRSIKVAGIILALAVIAAGVALEIADDAAANSMAAGHSEPFMAQ